MTFGAHKYTFLFGVYLQVDLLGLSLFLFLLPSILSCLKISTKIYPLSIFLTLYFLYCNPQASVLILLSMNLPNSIWLDLVLSRLWQPFNNKAFRLFIFNLITTIFGFVYSLILYLYWFLQQFVILFYFFIEFVY